MGVFFEGFIESKGKGDVREFIQFPSGFFDTEGFAIVIKMGKALESICIGKSAVAVDAQMKSAAELMDRCFGFGRRERADFDFDVGVGVRQGMVKDRRGILVERPNRNREGKRKGLSSAF